MSEIALPLNGVPELPLGGRLLGDEALAKLAARGSERAFAALYERHHQAIYRYCRSILHNDQDAQDAMQSAMTRAYAALRAQDRELTVKPWLFRIAHNEAISIVRKRRPEQELSDETEQLGSSVEHTVERRERLSTLVADLQTLPERQRGALLMRELSGLSIGEIASALQMSPGAAKQALFEARSSLHELAQGRTMHCESVMQAISSRDGRVLRSRRIRAHLRACGECRDFREAIGTRSAELAAIFPPLPATVASALLARLLADGGHGGVPASGPAAAAATHAGGVTATAGPGAAIGSHAAASLIGKGIAGVAVLAAATAGTVHFAATSTHRASPGHGASSAAHNSATQGADGASPADDSSLRAMRYRDAQQPGAHGHAGGQPVAGGQQEGAPFQEAFGSHGPSSQGSNSGSHGSGSGSHAFGSGSQRSSSGASGPGALTRGAAQPTGNHRGAQSQANARTTRPHGSERSTKSQPQGSRRGASPRGAGTSARGRAPHSHTRQTTGTATGGSQSSSRTPAARQGQTTQGSASAATTQAIQQPRHPSRT